MYRDAVPAEGRDPDWSALRAAFAWLRALDHCRQDPVHHAEGDVGAHTRAVVAEMLESAPWRAADAALRRVLFWAALLHDVGKPATTDIQPDGRVTARGHARRGAFLAREILYRLGAPRAEREAVAGLVRRHLAPFHLVDAADAVRRLYALSYETRSDHLAALARADIRGRICEDADRLHDQVSLFEAFAEEHGCLDAPRVFANDASRFEYFRRPDRDPAYAAHEAFKSEAVLLSGLPAVGKDTWVARRAPAGAVVVSLDALRAELRIAPGKPQGAVMAAAFERARDALRRGAPLVWNATNLGRDRRAGLAALCADYCARVRMVAVEADAATAFRRNAERERPVPPTVVAKMIAGWEPPTLAECHALEVVET